MDIGIAFDLRSDFDAGSAGPADRFEEYDSEATVAAISEALAKGGHAPRLLGGGRKFLQNVLARAPELIFNIAEGHGSRSREAHVPAVAEMLGIPFTHSDPLTLAVTLDKGVAKRIAASHGIATPRFAVVAEPGDLERLDLRPPLIAKPLFEGSSMGVRNTSKVGDAAALAALVGELQKDYREPVLVEEFLSGSEFTVGVVGNGRTARVLGVMEIVPRRSSVADFVYSLEVKRNYLEEVDYFVPPRQGPALEARVADVALRAFRALECRDVARVDIRLDALGVPHFLELNPLPGINPITGDIVVLCGLAKIPYASLILGIVEDARSRYGL